MGLLFVDCETTGLDPEQHEIWEIAWASLDGPVERRFVKEVDVSRADGTALRIGGFYPRWSVGSREVGARYGAGVAHEFVRASANRHLVGAVPSFDAAFLTRLLRKHGLVPVWHYHLVDVEALAAGKMGMQPPWNSEELSRAVGVEPGGFERHTARGDVLWARAIYRAVFRLGADD